MNLFDQYNNYVNVRGGSVDVADISNNTDRCSSFIDDNKPFCAKNKNTGVVHCYGDPPPLNEGGPRLTIDYKNTLKLDEDTYNCRPVLENELELVGPQYGNKLCSSAYHIDCDNQRLYYKTEVVPIESQSGDFGKCEEIESGKEISINALSNCTKQTDDAENNCDKNIDTSMKEYKGVSKAECEQEADRIAIIYTALAGFDPRGSSTIWEKQFQGIEQYAFYRSHPANPQRVKANRYASNKIKKHYIKGKVNPNVDKILKCNELFCNTSIADLSKDGSGGGVLKSLEVIGDLYLKNKQAKEEKKKQEQEIAKSKKILAQKRLLTPPNIKWDNTVPLRYKGTINRHNQKSGLNFGFAQNLSRGLFYYNFNNKLEKGEITFTGTNQHGYWFKWNDKYGHGNLQLREYTDGSLRGVIYIDDGTMLGKKLGDFIGFKK